MTKKRKSIADMGDVRKPERKEPMPTSRPAGKQPTVQIAVRINLDAYRQLEELIAATGNTQRATVEAAIAKLHGDIC